jgi:small-conductance mechanosensitive channel
MRHNWTETLLSYADVLIPALIFLAALAAARVTRFIFDRILKSFAARTPFRLDDLLLSILRRPMVQTVALVGTILAVRSANPPQEIRYYAESFILSLLILGWMISLVHASGLLLDQEAVRITDLTGIGRELFPMLKNLLRVVLIAAGGLLILSLWKVDISPMLASAGIAGVAVALAAKDTLANFFGGVSVFADRPYKLGDYIILDSGERGEVVDIGIRSTRIKTRDDVLISIPNSVMANAKITNESAPIPRFRIRVGVGVAYGSDVDHVERVLKEVARDCQLVLPEPEPRVRFRSFGDSALLFELLCWVEDPMFKGRAIHELNRGIYKRFAQEGIVIPYPQRDLHLVSLPTPRPPDEQ